MDQEAGLVFEVPSPPVASLSLRAAYARVVRSLAECEWAPRV